MSANVLNSSGVPMFSHFVSGGNCLRQEVLCFQSESSNRSTRVKEVLLRIEMKIFVSHFRKNISFLKSFSENMCNTGADAHGSAKECDILAKECENFRKN